MHELGKKSQNLRCICLGPFAGKSLMYIFIQWRIKSANIGKSFQFQVDVIIASFEN